MATTFPNTELLLSRDLVACDTETTGLEWWKGDKIFGISLSWRNDDGAYRSFYGDVREAGVLRWARDVIPRLRRITNHHSKFDIHMLRGSKIILDPRRIHCTLIRETILDEDQYEYSLDRLSRKYLGRGKEEIWGELARLFGGAPDKDTQILNLKRAPTPLVARYANVDSLNALQIHEKQEPLIDKEDLQRIAALEQALMREVVDMEAGGVPVNIPAAEQASEHLGKEVRRLQRVIDRMTKIKGFNVNSHIQVKKLLGVHQDANGIWWTKDMVKLEPTESGKTGSLKTEKLYQCTLPEATVIADLRSMMKAKDTFIDKYILTMSHKGLVHASINQTKTEEGDGTYTGRFSITEPALQQIHKRNKKMAAIVRSCFIPDDGCVWTCYDWAQKDFRIFGHYVNDPKINAIFAGNPRADFHRVTSDITGLPRDRDQKTGGANAKQMNLGLIFGMSAGRMAKEMMLPYSMRGSCRNEDCGMHGASVAVSPCPTCGKKIELYFEAGEEAQGLFSKYHKNIPGAEKLKKKVASIARDRGYITTQLGRRIRFPNRNMAYKAAGLLFQSQAAESMKVKIVELGEYQRSLPRDMMRLMVVVHDEYDISLREGRNPKIDGEIKHILERFDGDITPLSYRIPILADFGIGPNWWEASK
jgi:DNA polymerase-1